MARVNGVLYYIDLRNNELYGWEREKSKLVVASLAEQIVMGKPIPLVKVYQREDNVFELSSKDGGHNRVLAYMILKRSIPVILTNNPLGEPTPVNIRNIRLISDQSAINVDRFDYRKGVDPNYVPYSGNHPLINKSLMLI